MLRAPAFSIATVGAPLLLAVPACAQAVAGPVGVELEATTDHRRRGLSWSDGRPALSAYVRVPATSALSIEAEAVTTRGERRHEGADAALDLAGRYQQSIGAIDLDGGVVAHLFLGAKGTGYLELEGGASALIGPARLGGRAAYAPRQDAIGGDNLYLAADASVAVIGTPWTIRASVGRSSGDARGARSLRLRPRGRYADYMLGLDYVVSPVTLGVRITGTADHRYARTDASDLQRNMGRRVSAFVRLSF